MDKLTYWLKEFWQRKTTTYSLLRVFALLVMTLPLVYLIITRTDLLPDRFTAIFKFLPEKCQEVTIYGLNGSDTYSFSGRDTRCYTIFDKKYWSIENGSEVNEQS